MEPNHTIPEETGGTGLMLVVSFATILIVAGEAAFIAFASWWLLPLILLAVIAMAIVVIGAVIRTIDDGSLGGAAKPREQDEREPTAEPARPLPRVVPGH
jgi:fatty acid desaturase